MSSSFGIRLTTLVVLLVSVSACSMFQKVMPGKKVDYKQSRSEPSLEIPPDLNSTGVEDSLVIPSTTYSEYKTTEAKSPQSQAGAQVLPTPEGMQIEHDGDRRWLVVDAPPEAVWPKVRDFWVKNGFLLTEENPKLGLLETDWAENRADIPQGPIRNALGKALDFLYSAPTRDRFRVRLERGTKPGTTEIYLTQQGMEEVTQGPSYDEGSTIWQARPNDPGLEAEMLKRLMVYLGAKEDQAAQQLAQKPVQPPRAQLITNGQGETELRIAEDFSRAWRSTGIALDRVGFTVEDRNRSEGIYYVRYNDPLKADKKKGFLSKLAFWRDDEDTAKAAPKYQIHLNAQGGQTQVVVQNAEGARDNSPTAKRILTLLQEQLK